MHQYIREQADALAQRRLEEYQQPQEWEDIKSQGKCHLIRDRSLEEGDQMKTDQSLGRGPSKKETQRQRIPTKSGVTGSAYPHSMGGMAPGGWRRELHHQVEEVPQMIKEMMNQMRRKMRRMILMKKLYQ